MAGTVETFDQEAYKTGLASLLGQHVAKEQITLTIASASIRVTAEIQTTVTVEEAQSTVLATLNTLTATSLSAAVGGGVSIAAVERPTLVARVIPASEITAGTLPGGSGLNAPAAASDTSWIIYLILGLSALGLALFGLLAVGVWWRHAHKKDIREERLSQIDRLEETSDPSAAVRRSCAGLGLDMPVDVDAKEAAARMSRALGIEVPEGVSTAEAVERMSRALGPERQPRLWHHAAGVASPPGRGRGGVEPGAR